MILNLEMLSHLKNMFLCTQAPQHNFNEVYEDVFENYALSHALNSFVSIFLFQGGWVGEYQNKTVIIIAVRRLPLMIFIGLYHATRKQLSKLVNNISLQ